MKVTIGDRVKSLREQKDINQTELAKKLGISKSVMSRVEAGTRPVEDSLLIKLTEVLEASADYLLGISFKFDSHLSRNDKIIIELLRQLPESQKNALKNFIESMRSNSEENKIENN